MIVFKNYYLLSVYFIDKFFSLWGPCLYVSMETNLVSTKTTVCNLGNIQRLLPWKPTVCIYGDPVGHNNRPHPAVWVDLRPEDLRLWDGFWRRTRQRHRTAYCTVSHGRCQHRRKFIQL